MTTGFARVAQNLFPRWNKAGVLIDCWAIGFKGWRYKDCPYVNMLFPAGVGGEWNLIGNLELFLQQLMRGGYTHVWMMQDTFQLCGQGFPEALEKICTEGGIVSMLYFPVDAPLDKEWTEIIEAVDIPVAYTEYGRGEAQMVGNFPGADIHVLPHGVDTKVYRPLPNRMEVRRAFWRTSEAGDRFIEDDDFLMVNVNANQRRKDVVRSLEILAGLKDAGVKAKLVMHMPERSFEGLSLHQVGEQLGLEVGKDWGHHGQYFSGSISSMVEKDLVRLYNAADLYLTTSLGEGWGLGITEALACGCPVALPNHTSCAEIHEGLEQHNTYRTQLLEVEKGYVGLDYDNSRLRRRVDLGSAVDAIYHLARRAAPGIDYRERPELNEGVRQWLSWDRIAKEFLNLMKGFKKSPEPQSVKGEQGVKGVNPPTEVGEVVALVDGKQGEFTYYLEFGGGLGDVFNQMYSRGTYNVLRDLGPEEEARVCLVTHNPFVWELFDNHPKRKQMLIEDLGYWHTAEENKVNRATHAMPEPGANGLLPEKDKSIRFYPMPEDRKVFDEVYKAGSGPWVVLAATAGLSDRSIPESILLDVLPKLEAAGCLVLVVGRDYDRHGRKEFVPYFNPGRKEFVPYFNPRMLNLVNRLSVPGTAWLVQVCAGLVTCHSALNILAWHERVPQLLLYPHSVWERHIQHRDQWAFGVDYPECFHVDFGDVASNPDVFAGLFSRFIETAQKRHGEGRANRFNWGQGLQD